METSYTINDVGADDIADEFPLASLETHHAQAGGCWRQVQLLPAGGAISALNIPHSSMVFDQFLTVEIQAELLGGSGVVMEKLKHADIVSFSCLKAFTFDQRFERKVAFGASM